MNEWHRILTKVLTHGVTRPDRTGVGTFSTFGEQLVFDNRPETFPAVTTKHLAFGQVKAELACFLRGLDSLDDFHKLGCRIWDANGAAPYWRPERAGYLGRIYGVQWRRWKKFGHWPGGELKEESHDQLRAMVNGMLLDPFGRRHLVTAWNPGELNEMCLPPCHVLFQAYVEPEQPGGGDVDYHVDLRVDMRSVDLFLGLPFDIASYALLQKLLCRQLNLDDRHARIWSPRWLTFQLGDSHIYLNHQDAVRTVLSREPLTPPDLVLSGNTSPLLMFHPSEADLVGYNHHGPVPAPLNV